MKYPALLLALFFAACDGGPTPSIVGFSVDLRDAVWPPPDGAVNDAVPPIRWPEVSGAVRYEVTVADDATLSSIRESFATTGTEVVFSDPLADRAAAYVQVEAYDDADILVARDAWRFRYIEPPAWLSGIALLTRDAARSQGGYRLFNLIDFAPADGIVAGFVLVDANGQMIWWYLHPGASNASDIRVLDNNNLYFQASFVDANGTIAKSQAFEMKWDGTVVWESRPGTLVHHEAGIGPGGQRMLLTWEHEVFDNVVVEGDGIEIVDRATNTVTWTWNLFDHFDPESWPTPEIAGNFTGLGADWSHANALAWDPARGLIWMSVRHFDALLGIAYPSGEIAVILGNRGIGGEGLIRHQHAPEVQPDGTILLWDNGNGRTPPYSRWEWRGDPDFFDFAVGDADRLPNGNTLITAGVSGRIIEVDPLGEIVWEIAVSPGVWWIYRAEHLPADRVPESLKAFGD